MDGLKTSQTKHKRHILTPPSVKTSVIGYESKITLKEKWLLKLTFICVRPKIAMDTTRYTFGTSHSPEFVSNLGTSSLESGTFYKCKVFVPLPPAARPLEKPTFVKNFVGLKHDILPVPESNHWLTLLSGTLLTWRLDLEKFKDTIHSKIFCCFSPFGRVVYNIKLTILTYTTQWH